LTIFHAGQLHSAQLYNRPLLNETYVADNAESKRTAPILSVVIGDGHIYRQPLDLKQGKGRDSCKIGIGQYSNESFIIIDSFYEITGCKLAYIRANENELDKYVKSKMIKEKKIFNVVTLDKEQNILSCEINGVLYRYAPDINKSLALLDRFPADKRIEYHGQSYHSILQAYGRVNHDIYPHSLSVDTYDIFKRLITYPQVGLLKPGRKLSEPGLVCVDVRNCYKSQAIVYDRPNITLNDEYIDFTPDMEIKPHYGYIVDAPQYASNFLLSGYGNYNGQVVEYALEKGIITKSDIIRVIEPAKSKASYKCLIDDVPECENIDWNKMIGNMVCGSTYSNHSIIYSTSLEYIMSYQQTIYNDTRDKVNFAIGKLDIGVPLYTFYGCLKTPNNANYIPDHVFIIQLTFLNIYKHLEKIAEYNNTTIAEILVAINVDCLVLEPWVKLPLDHVKPNKSVAIPGDIVVCEKPKRVITAPTRERYAIDPYYPAPSFEERKRNIHINYIDLPKGVTEPLHKFALQPLLIDGSGNIPENTPLEELCTSSFALIADGGFGKSHKLGQIDEFLTKKGVKYVVIAPTHTAVDVVNSYFAVDKAMTISSFLGLHCNDEKTRECSDRKQVCKWDKSIECVIIDEISLITDIQWLAILKNYRKNYLCKIILSGDMLQIPGIKMLSPLNPYRSLIKYLCKGRYLTMTTNYRLKKILDAPFDEQDPLKAERFLKFTEETKNVRRGAKLNTSLYAIDSNFSCEINIAPTNELVDIINTIQAAKRSPNPDYKHPIVKFHIFVGMPLIAIETNDNYKNGQRFIVKNITDSTITVSRIVRGAEQIVEVPAKLINTQWKQNYACTADKSQGLTIEQPYAIWAIDHFLNKRWGVLYTLISRTRDPKYIMIGDVNKLNDFQLKIKK